jgi:hypothetical protein
MPLVSVKLVEAFTEKSAAWHHRLAPAATLRRPGRLIQAAVHGTALPHPS